MAKRSTFEELLNREFRWPQLGDDPFALPEGSNDYARIDEHGFGRFVLMMDGYKIAAERLVDWARESNRQRDILIYPILFLYRHCLELHLKYIINTYGPHVGIEPDWKTHNLTALWKKFTNVLDEFGTEDPDDADPIVGGVVAQFAKIDPGSFSYRYPCDVSGNLIPVDQNALHLETLRDVMDGVFGYFSGCDGYLDNMVSAAP